MPERRRYWVHGVDVNIEYPHAVDEVRRAGPGTEITLGEDSWNWLHLAVPTPTGFRKEDDERIEIIEIHLEARTNENARVDRVHAWDGEDRFFLKDGLSGLENEHFHEWWTLNHEPSKGVCINAHVEGLGDEPQPEIQIIGGGALFIV